MIEDSTPKLWMRACKVVAIIALAAPIDGCEMSIVSPIKPPKDPRQYTFTIDTLYIPATYQINLVKLFAVSRTDVYVVGHSAANKGMMWHFDGNQWSDVKLMSNQGGVIDGLVDLIDIFGFASNNIFSVGGRIHDNPSPPPNYLDSSVILHFEGSQWTEMPIARGRILQGVWGSAPNDLWAGGFAGALYHYDGTSWVKTAFSSDINISQFGGLSSNDVYAVGYTLYGFIDSTIYSMWHWDGHAWSLKDAFNSVGNTKPKFGQWEIKQIAGELYSCGRGVFKLQSGVWEQMLAEPQGLMGIDGTSGSNIFAVGRLGIIYHFNGVDWYRYTATQKYEFDMADCWTDGYELFVLGSDGFKSYILHGK